MEHATEMLSLDMARDGWQSDAPAIFDDQNEGEDIDMHPFVIRKVPLTLTDESRASPEQKAVCESYKSFLKDFANSEARTTQLRCSRPVCERPNCQQQSDAWLRTDGASLVPVGARMGAALPESALKSLCMLNAWAMKSNEAIVSEEKGSVWTCRLCLQGERIVAMADMTGVRAVMSELQVVGSVNQWGKELSARDVATLTNKVLFEKATLGAGDCLFVPAGKAIWEEVYPGKDAAGLKWGMVLQRDRQRYQRFVDQAGARMTPSSHISKHVVRACTG